MKNQELKLINETYTNRTNKDLANILATLELDFKNIKGLILELTDTLKEVEITYDNVYGELEKRLKFETKNEK
jgi:hypothetical protein